LSSADAIVSASTQVAFLSLQVCSLFFGSFSGPFAGEGGTFLLVFNRVLFATFLLVPEKEDARVTQFINGGSDPIVHGPKNLVRYNIPLPKVQDHPAKTL
jgi:hypothetical protein